MAAPDQETDYVAYAGLALLSLCFGGSFLFNALSLQWVNAVGSNSGRMIVAAIFLVPIAIVAGPGLPKTISQWRWVATLGVFGLWLPFLLAIWGQRYLPSNVAAAYFASIPLLMLIFSRLILKIPITKRKGMGLVVGSIGLVLLSGPGTFSQIGAQGVYLPQIAIVAGCVLLAGAAIFVRMMPKAPPIQTTAGAVLTAGVVSVPFAISEIPMDTTPPLVPLLALIGAGVISTGTGNLLRYFLIRRRGPVFITPNAYLTTLVAAILGVLFLDEVLTPATLLAFGIIVAGLFIAQDGSGAMEKA